MTLVFGSNPKKDTKIPVQSQCEQCNIKTYYEPGKPCAKCGEILQKL